MAGSIPVIDSEENDYKGATFFNRLGYRYFKTDQVVNVRLSAAELKNIADENYDLFVRYQTWVHGDLVPPAYAKFKVSCMSSSDCCALCLDGTTQYRDCNSAP